MIRIGLGPALVLGTLPQAQDAPPPAVGAEVRERIEARANERLWGLHEELAFPGLSAALVLPDGSLLALTVGFADLDSEEELRPEHRLLSGSVGKTFVSAAAHRLLLEGRLSFGQRAIEFFEGEEWFLRLANAETMTIGDLLRHESGLARYVFQPDFFPACVADPDRVWKPRELLEFVFDLDPLFEAGKGWAYADTNYIVVGMVLEKVTGRRFYDYVREELLEPNGLEDTIPTDRRRLPGVVQGHVVASRAFGFGERVQADGQFVFNPQFEWCGGGYAHTASDLARWAWRLYRGEAFPGDYLSTLLDSVPSGLGRGREYGYGVMVGETPVGPQWGHDGFFPGYTATMAYFPEVEVACAILMNTDAGLGPRQPLDALALELASIAREELGR